MGCQVSKQTKKTKFDRYKLPDNVLQVQKGSNSSLAKTQEGTPLQKKNSLGEQKQQQQQEKQQQLEDNQLNRNQKEQKYKKYLTNKLNYTSPQDQKQQQNQLQNLGNLIPSYQVSLDYLEERITLKELTEEPIPIIEPNISKSFIAKKREIHQKLLLAKKLQQHNHKSVTQVLEKVDKDIKKIYDIQL